MKKWIICALFLTLGLAQSQAQSFSLGLKAGVNFAKLQADYASGENVVGYNVGAWARIGAASFYVQPEAYIGSKGTKFLSVTQNGGNEVAAEAKVKFTTLNVPVLLGTKFGLKNYNVRIMAGPVVSFILDDNSTFSAAYQQATDFGNYKNQSFGVQAGAGLDVGKLSFDLRYEAGLSNLSKSDRYKQKSNVFQLSIGYKLL